MSASDPAAFKRPESVLILVYSRDRQVLVLRRCGKYPFWQSVTGSLRWDESPRDAASRELTEETGLGPTPALVDCGYARRFRILPGWSSRFAPGTVMNLEHVFAFELPSPVAVTPNPIEHDAWEWLRFDMAIERVWSWTNRAALLELRAWRAW